MGKLIWMDNKGNDNNSVRSAKFFCQHHDPVSWFTVNTNWTDSTTVVRLAHDEAKRDDIAIVNKN